MGIKNIESILFSLILYIPLTITPISIAYEEIETGKAEAGKKKAEWDMPRFLNTPPSSQTEEFPVLATF